MKRVLYNGNTCTMEIMVANFFGGVRTNGTLMLRGLMAHLCFKVNFLKFSLIFLLPFTDQVVAVVHTCLSPPHCYESARSPTPFCHSPHSAVLADILTKCQMKQHRHVFPEA